MQPYTEALANEKLTPQQTDLVIGKLKYRADLTKGVVSEAGPKGTKEYKIEHALGGKNVYYFLTPFPRGRLQTLPIAYDVRTKQWFDTAASGVRHFPGARGDQSVSWRDPGYTFNTGCYNCHVSQLTSHYNIKTDTYKTDLGRSRASTARPVTAPPPSTTASAWRHPKALCPRT